MAEMFDDLVPKGEPAPAGGGLFDDLVPKAKPTPGLGESVVGGALAGVSANWRDEIYGASKASGLPDWAGGFRAPVGAARLAYERMTGEPGPVTAKYESARDEMRARQKALREAHPYAYGAGEIGGALAVPGSAMLNAATLPARIGRGAMVGAGYGGLSGFGEGEGVADSASRGLTGTAVGSVVGAVAPPLVEGAIRGAGALSQPIVNAVRGAVRPETEAARRVVTAIERDIQSDPNAVARLTPPEYVAAAQQGAPVGLLDLGGNLTRRLVDTAAITSPEGSTTVNQMLNRRFETQSQRLSDWLDRRFNFPDALAQQEAIQNTAQGVNRAAYNRAYRDGDHGLWSPELERLTSSPDMVAAMRDAATKGKSRAVTEGFGGFNPGVVVDNGGIVTFQRGPTGRPTYPNLQFWDYTKRSLDDAASAARRAGRNDEARVLGNLSQGLRGELDNLVPSYQQARAGAAHFFGAENALEAGQNFVGSRFAAPQARQVVARMSPVERQLFQDGYVSRFIQRVNETGDRRNLGGSLLNSPAERERMAVALGPQAANELEAVLRVERIMDMGRSAVQGNSWTARRLYDLGIAGGGLETLHGGLNQSPGEMTAGALVAAVASGGRHADQRVMRRVAEMLSSNDPAVLQRGVAMLARSQNFMNRLRAVDQRVIRAGGQEGAAVPPLQLPGIGRADEDQQNIPRPPREQKNGGAIGNNNGFAHGGKVPPVHRRKEGGTYHTPKGPAIWRGKGWEARKNAVSREGSGRG